MTKIDGRSVAAKLAKQESLANSSNTSEVVNTEVVQQTPSSVPPPEAPKIPVPTGTPPEVMNMLQNMYQEIQELKSKTENKPHMMTKAREIYAWPWEYKYKLYWEIPVLSFKSKKIDKTKDYHYKNLKWEYMSNHILEISLADGTTVDVDVIDFNRSITYSNLQQCEVIKDERGTVYVFNHPQYGSIEVLSSVIN